MNTEATIRIAIFDADVPVPAVRSKRGLYSDIFADLLHKANKKRSGDKKSTPPFEFEAYNVVQGDYPGNLENLDGILITGAAAAAYDQVPWIIDLDNYIQEVYAHYPHIRWFGSCFGHQIICQALLTPYGVKVEKDPKGLEIGVHPVTLTPEFLEHAKNDCSVPLPNQLRFQFVHGDHVVIPPTASLPEDWIVMGSSKHCAVQGIAQPGRVLAYQGHFEFDRFVNGESVALLAPLWGVHVPEDVIKGIDADDDADIAAVIVADFFSAGRTRKSTRSKTGLLTPPDEE